MGNFDFSLAIAKFTACRNELQVQIHGGRYNIPDSNEIIEYHGINYTNEVTKLLQMSTDKKMSYIALREAELIMTKIQDVRVSTQIVRIELKAVLNRKDLSRNASLSASYSILKGIYDKVCGFLDICDSQYKYITEIVFGVTQLNSSINKRFFGGQNFMYDYKNEEGE